MSKPKSEVKEKEYYRDIYFLYEILSSLRNIDELKVFIKDILTRTELRMLKRRWHIANLLIEGYDMRTVAQKAKVSTSTVLKIKKIIEEGHGGLVLAIMRVKDKLRQEQNQRAMPKDAAGGRGSSKFVKNWFR